MMTRLKLLSWNVNGLRAVHRKGDFQNFLELGGDILCLQETKASPDQLADSIRQIEGYKEYFSSAERKGYSGVATYTRIEPVSVEYGMGIEKFDREGRILVLDYQTFILCNIYFPNGKASEERLQYKMDFYDAFLKHALHLVESGRNVVVCGDVNTAHKEIDLARPKENEKISGFLPQERAWMDEFVASGFVDTFRAFNQEPEQYTWWHYISNARARNVGWRIDYFYVNEGLKGNVVDAFIVPEIMGSDHCPVGLTLDI